MYKYGLLIILLFQSLFAQKVLTSREAVRIALNKNTELQKMKESIKVTEAGVKSAYGAFMPNVSASAMWNWDRNSNSFGPNDVTTTTHTYSTGVRADVTLFDGLANVANYKNSQQQLEAAQLSLEQRKQDIIFQTLSAYYDVVNAGKQVTVKEEDLKWNQKNYEIILESNKLGKVTLADVYASQVKVGNAELALITQQNTFENLKSEFLFALGLDVLENYQLNEPALEEDITSQVAASTKEYDNLSKSIENALSVRSDFQSQKLSLSSAKLAVDVSKAGYLPQLNANVGYSFGATDFSNVFKNRDLTAGLTLSIPLFSGWKTDAAVEQATVSSKLEEIKLNDLTRSIKKSLQKSYLDFQAVIKRVEVGTKNVTAAQENRRIEEEKYTLGSTTLLNVLIANSEYTNAVTNLLNSQFEFRKLRDQLQYLVGKLESKSFE
ncbi:MAG: TolC family protein [Ignavibacteria bacterium]|nr:TolC family protein [Ignavibacteria bacterium]